MTIIERALEFVADHSTVGLGSGRAAQAFVRGMAERVRAGRLHVHAVPTSKETADLARSLKIPLVTLDEAGTLDVTIDGADEVESPIKDSVRHGLLSFPALRFPAA